jgi:hypothetical protein
MFLNLQGPNNYNVYPLLQQITYEFRNPEDRLYSMLSKVIGGISTKILSSWSS